MTLAEPEWYVHKSSCGNSVRQIGLACLLYARDGNGYTPPNLAATLPFKLFPYILNHRLAICCCPEDRMSDLLNEVDKDTLSANIDYYSSYQICESVNLKELDKRETYPLVWEKRPFHIYRWYEGDPPHRHLREKIGLNVFFADGHLEYLTPTELLEFLRASGASKEAWEELPSDE